MQINNTIEEKSKRQMITIHKLMNIGYDVIERKDCTLYTDNRLPVKIRRNGRTIKCFIHWDGKVTNKGKPINLLDKYVIDSFYR